MSDRFCRDCRHFRDLGAEQAAEEAANAPSGFWGFLMFLAPPRPTPYPIFEPRRCLREISLVTGEPLHLSADTERLTEVFGCGRDAAFWEPISEGLKA